MTTDSALIVYDGECIYCQNYVRLVRLRASVGAVELLDARSGDPRVADFQRRGYDLNEGMLFVYNGVVHHGSNAIHALALLSDTTGFLGRLNRMVFGSRQLSALAYPVLKLGRRATLALRGRGLIPDQDRQG